MTKAGPQGDSKKAVIKVLIVDDIPETRENLKKFQFGASDLLRDSNFFTRRLAP